MKKLTTILCSIAFMIAGISMAITVKDPSYANSGYKTMAAATLPSGVQLPNLDDSRLHVPLDLLLDEAKRQNVLGNTFAVNEDPNSEKIDSLQNRISYLEEKEQATRDSMAKAPAPKSIVKTKVITRHIHTTDTIHVPVYYLATQVGNKEGPTDQCVSVYEVHKVDEICPENTNSSEKHTNEYVDAGE